MLDKKPRSLCTPAEFARWMNNLGQYLFVPVGIRRRSELADKPSERADERSESVDEGNEIVDKRKGIAAKRNEVFDKRSEIVE